MSLTPTLGPSAEDTMSPEKPEVWGLPGQACLPGWTGVTCHPGCRELPGAGRREPRCRQSPTAWAPLQRPRSLAMQRARAAPSSSCRSRLLPRKTEQRAVEKCQASAPRSSQRCPTTAEHKGEVSFRNEGPRGLSSLLPLSDGDGRALQEGQQQQPQCSTSACLQEEQRKTILPPSSPNSPDEFAFSPPSLPEGTSDGHSSAPACKKCAALTEQPHSRKGPQQAASAPGHV